MIGWEESQVGGRGIREVSQRWMELHRQNIDIDDIRELISITPRKCYP